MPALPQKRLNLVTEPLAVGAVADAPPALEAIRPTVEYTCGNCDAVLIRGDEDKVLALIIHCTACGSYNSTGV
jgi:DNA-directed RNA polymerase subunit RPC12/RpoP